MYKSALAGVLASASMLTVSSLGQSVASSAQGTPGAPPHYVISFKRGDPVVGVTASPAIRLPFDCTSDGTIFVEFASFPRVNSGLPPLPPGPPPMLLTSIPKSGYGRTFRLDQVPNLYISEEVDYFAFDSGVLFLVKASLENKPQKRAYTVGDYHGEYTINTAEQSSYIVVFSRDGEYKRAIRVADDFEIRKLAIFPSGVFLAFGYDRRKHAPKAVMLREDGTLLKSLEIPQKDVPESMSDSSHTIVPAQIVGRDHTLIIALTKGSYPLLEISEGGALRTISPRLAVGEQLESLVPADKGIFVVARRESQKDSNNAVIYELRPEDGTPIWSFELSDGRSADSVACVNNEKFLSIDYGSDKVVPLIGTAMPEAEQR